MLFVAARRQLRLNQCAMLLSSTLDSAWSAIGNVQPEIAAVQGCAAACRRLHAHPTSHQAHNRTPHKGTTPYLEGSPGPARVSSQPPYEGSAAVWAIDLPALQGQEPLKVSSTPQVERARALLVHLQGLLDDGMQSCDFYTVNRHNRLGKNITRIPSGSRHVPAAITTAIAAALERPTPIVDGTHVSSDPHPLERGFSRDALQLMERLPHDCHLDVYLALRALGMRTSQPMLKLVLISMGDDADDLLVVQLFNDWVRLHINGGDSVLQCFYYLFVCVCQICLCCYSTCVERGGR